VRTKRIPINDIICDKELMPREKINEEYVNELVEDIKRRDKLPPVDLFYDGKRYYVVDGYHRIEALKMLGHKDISAKIHKGTRRNANLFSCGVNAKHGLRRNNKDKRKAVTKLLKDKQWTKWSDISQGALV